jgi:hypothetical protein
MGVLSKNSLVILILFLSFVGCKDNDKPEPINEVVYEDWSKIPNTEIYLSSRNVTALEGYDSFLFVQCLKSFYILNSDLHRVDGGGRSLSKEPFFDNRPKIGSDWTVINGDRGFEVFSNFNPVNERFGLRLYYQNYIGNQCTFVSASHLNDKNSLSVIWSFQKTKDSVDYYLDTYKFDEYVDKIVDSSRLRLEVYNDYYQRIRDVAVFNEVTYCSIGGLTYRIEDNVLTDSIRFDLRNFQKFRNGIIAFGQRVFYVGDKEPNKEGIMYSGDNGKTWEYLYSSEGYINANLKIVNDKIFLFKGQDMIHLDLDNGVQKGLNMTGLDAFIKDISFVAGKVIVGTDAGVYYKSWESFLNK